MTIDERINNALERVEDGERPPETAINRTKYLLEYLEWYFNGLPDGVRVNASGWDGGLELICRRPSGRAIHAVVPFKLETPLWVFHRGGKTHGTQECPVLDHVAEWFEWVQAEV